MERQEELFLGNALVRILNDETEELPLNLNEKELSGLFMPQSRMEGLEKSVLIKKRGQVKAKLTLFQKFVSEWKPDLGVSQLKLRLGKLDGQVWDEFNQIQSEIELVDDDPNQQTERMKFENDFYTVVAKVQDIIENYDKKPLISPNASQSSFEGGLPAPTLSKVKLPQISLPEFRGSFEDWLHFRDVFYSLIDKNPSLTPVDKFHYLLSAVKGSAAEAIESLQVTNDNYVTALKVLKDRFEVPHLIIQHLMHVIFNYPKLDNECPRLINKLVDCMQKCVNSLDTMKVSKEKLGDAFLTYLIATKLDLATIRAWNLQLDDKKLPTFEEMKEFLLHRCQRLQSTSDLVERDTSKGHVPKKQNKTFHCKVMTQRESTKIGSSPKSEREVQTCKLCMGKHKLYQCQEFNNFSVEQRVKFVKKSGLCFNCLRANHRVANCQITATCKHCGKRHNSLIHIDRSQNTTHSCNTSHPQGEGAMIGVQRSVGPYKCVLLSTAIIKVQSQDGNWHKCRALLDNGAQSSLITMNCCNKLKLPKHDIQIKLLGIGNAITAMHATSFKLQSIVNSQYEKRIESLVVPSITGGVPHINLGANQLKFPEGFKLADEHFGSCTPIDILLAADQFWDILQFSRVEMQPGLYLQQTKLGYIVTGAFPSMNPVQKSVCNLSVTAQLQETLHKFWEIEGIEEDGDKSTEERLCEDLYCSTVRRNSEGRYIVKLPIKGNSPKLGDSKPQALKRLYSMERRLANNQQFKKQYNEFMTTYASLGHMKISPCELFEKDDIYFIPHHSVVNEKSTTTKLRIVFDASSRSDNGVSLNDILLKGPTLQDDVLSILCRFRKYKYVIQGDIAMMYRQILIDDSHHHYQQILWRENKTQPVQTFTLQTVTYGVRSAPYLAIRTLHQLADDEVTKFPRVASIIKKDFYVDDCLTGCDDVSELKDIRRELTALLHLGGFHIRKWMTNSMEVMQSIPEAERALEGDHQLDRDVISRTLGLRWLPHSDEFNYIAVHTPHKFTKREILRQISRIFDPLGLIAPVIVVAKLIMKKIWLSNQQWDENISEDITVQWRCFCERMHNISCISIPRLIVGVSDPCLWELHAFGDASEEAYGCCVYLRVGNKHGQYSARLVASKSRVTPSKPTVTIPKLELCAALLAAQLLQRVTLALSMCITNSYCWTDSQIVLAWIRQHSLDRLPIFVANRVEKIKAICKPSQWYYVSTIDNPADIVSRGRYPEELATEQKWWNGPKWLEDSSYQLNYRYEQTESMNSVCIAIQTTKVENSFFGLFSSMIKLVKVVAYCVRFLKNCKLPATQRITGNLTIQETNDAWKRIVKLVQDEVFVSEKGGLVNHQSLQKSSKLYNLNPFIDKEGIIRVGGRLQNSSESFEVKHPAILPSDHVITKLIIRHEHLRNLHCNFQTLHYILRKQFWILAARRTIKSVLHKCIVCQKAKPRLATQLMGQLPRDRVTPFRPFLIVGVDYAGPLYIRSGARKSLRTTKAYLAVFVCFATTAVHLELVGDMTSQSFLACLKRFIARRGRPVRIYSDNGANFVGASRELKELHALVLSQTHNEVVSRDLHEKGIEWKFIPPYSAHFGGLWESVVRRFKYHFNRIVGGHSYTYEQCLTLVVQIEGVINSRPLTVLSMDSDTNLPLSPGHFLIGDHLQQVPEPNYLHIPQNRLSMWQLIQTRIQDFWRRWSNEYLVELQQRSKWCTREREVQMGAIVLIKDPNAPPMKWRLGRVIELHPGRDGIVRVVTLQTKDGCVRRAIHNIAPLPIDTKFLVPPGVCSDHDSEPSHDTLTSLESEREP